MSATRGKEGWGESGGEEVAVSLRKAWAGLGRRQGLDRGRVWELQNECLCKVRKKQSWVGTWTFSVQARRWCAAALLLRRCGATQPPAAFLQKRDRELGEREVGVEGLVSRMSRSDRCKRKLVGCLRSPRAHRLRCLYVAAVTSSLVLFLFLSMQTRG